MFFFSYMRLPVSVAVVSNGWISWRIFFWFFLSTFSFSFFTFPSWDKNLFFTKFLKQTKFKIETFLLWFQTRVRDYFKTFEYWVKEKLKSNFWLCSFELLPELLTEPTCFIQWLVWESSQEWCFEQCLKHSAPGWCL